jgi:hypothetical protein
MNAIDCSMGLMEFLERERGLRRKPEWWDCEPRSGQELERQLVNFAKYREQACFLLFRHAVLSIDARRWEDASMVHCSMDGDVTGAAEEAYCGRSSSS